MFYHFTSLTPLQHWSKGWCAAGDSRQCQGEPSAARQGWRLQPPHFNHARYAHSSVAFRLRDTFASKTTGRVEHQGSRVRAIWQCLCLSLHLLFVLVNSPVLAHASHSTGTHSPSDIAKMLRGGVLLSSSSSSSSNNNNSSRAQVACHENKETFQRVTSLIMPMAGTLSSLRSNCQCEPQVQVLSCRSRHFNLRLRSSTHHVQHVTASAASFIEQAGQMQANLALTLLLPLSAPPGLARRCHTCGDSVTW
jgi:hypothetical protein